MPRHRRVETLPWLCSAGCTSSRLTGPIRPFDLTALGSGRPMIPLRDENPTRTVPWVNYGIIALNVLVWGWQLVSEMAGISWLTAAYGMVPRRLLADPLGEVFTIFS